LFLSSSPPGLAGPAAHETLLLCGRVVGTEVGIPLVRLSPLSSYFLAQNCGRRGCGWNRNVCRKLQGRTDLQLTPMAAYESFL
jgi:hypothetical protein